MPTIPVLLTKDIPATGDVILSYLRRWKFSHSATHTLLIQMAEYSNYGYHALTQEQLKTFLLKEFSFTRQTTKGERKVGKLSVKLVRYVFTDPNNVLLKTG